jgi:hypothetical protein
MHGVIPPLSNIFSCSSASLRRGTILHLPTGFLFFYLSSKNTGT